MEIWGRKEGEPRQGLVEASDSPAAGTDTEIDATQHHCRRCEWGRCESALLSAMGTSAEYGKVTGTFPREGQSASFSKSAAAY